MASRDAALPRHGKRPWGVRTSLPNGTHSWVMICFHNGDLYALHGFIKKTQKTPDADLVLARKQMKEIENG